VAALDSHTEKLRLLANAPSTLQTYKNAWASFKTFQKTIQATTTKTVTEQHLTRFISYLSLIKQLAPTTIKTYVAGIRYNLKLRNMQAFDDSFMIKRILLGSGRTYISPSKRAALTLDKVTLFVKALPSVTQNPYKTKMFAAAILMSYYGLMRPGECVGSTHAVQFKNVIIHKDHVLITLDHSKANQDGSAEIIRINQVIGPMCPVETIKQYVKLRGKRPGAFFTSALGKPLSYQAYSAIFRQLCIRTGLDPKRYTPHSPRIGRVTDLKRLGATDGEVQTAGRWTSNAYKSYDRSVSRNMDRRKRSRGRCDGAVGGQKRKSQVPTTPTDPHPSGQRSGGHNRHPSNNRRNKNNNNQPKSSHHLQRTT